MATISEPDAILNTLISPNEADSNFENANIVDVVAKLSRATYRVSKAISVDEAGSVVSGMYAIAASIDRLASVIQSLDGKSALDRMTAGIVAGRRATEASK